MVWSSVKNFFLEDGGGQGSPKNTAAMNTRTDADGSMAALEKHLAAICRENGSFVGGKINFLNLSHLKEKLGPKWPRVSRIVHMITEDIIKTNLDENDFFVRVNEKSYIIVFDDLTQEQARLKCALIGQAILRKLLGETKTSDMLEVSTAVAQVDGSVGLERVSLFEKMNQALDNAEPDIVTTSAVKKGTANSGDDASATPDLAKLFLEAANKLNPDFPDDLPQEAKARANAQSGKPGELTQQQFEHGMDALLALLGTQGGALDLDVPDFLDEIEADENIEGAGTKDAKRTVKLTKGPEKASVAPPAISLHYRPMWNIKNNVISEYQSQLCLQVEKSVFEGETIFGQNADDRILAAADNYVLRKSLTDLCKVLRKRAKNIMIVPVHYETFSSQRSMDGFTSLCRSIPKSLKRFIVWEIITTHSQFMLSRVFDIAKFLENFGHAIVLRTDIDYTLIDELSDMGIYAVGCDMTSETLTEADAIKKMESFVTRASRCRLRTCINGLNTTSLVTASVCAGFDYVGGRAVSKALETPVGIRPFTTLDMYNGTALDEL